MIGSVTTSIRVAQRLERRGLSAKVAEIAAAHNALPDEVIGRVRTPRIVEARRACWAHCYALGYSTVEIGALWGVDHSTVVAGLRALGIDRRSQGGKARAK